MNTLVTITSVVPLTEAQTTRLSDALTKKYGPVEITQKIDENLLGGVKVTVGSEQFDASLSTKISQLKQNVK